LHVHDAVLFFFLRCPLPHPDLHSFPTRRSSDLEAGFKGRSKLAGSTWQSYYGSYAYRSDSIPEQSSQTQELNRTGLDRSASLRLDRKSTRLNSSHVKTSYAVFCLKNKNDQHKTE